MIKLFGTAFAIFAVSGPLWAGHAYGGHACGHGGKAAFYLLTLALGYWLLRVAEKEDSKRLKKVGRAVSWIILVVSFFGLLCKAAAGFCRWKCPPGSKMGCPWMSGPTPSESTPAVPQAQ